MSCLETVTVPSLLKCIPSFKSSNHSTMLTPPLIYFRPARASCQASTSYRLTTKRRGWPGIGERRQRRSSNGYARPRPINAEDRFIYLLGHGAPRHEESPQIQFLEKVVALVVDDDEGRKIHHVDAPDRFHPEFGIFHDLDLPDAVFGKVCRSTPDRAEVEAAMLLAGLAHGRRAVALGEHHHRAAGCLELIDKGIHASRGRGTEGARRIAFRGFGGTGVIDRMVLEIMRQRLAALQPLAQFGVRRIPRHDHGTRERQAGLDRMF